MSILKPAIPDASLENSGDLAIATTQDRTRQNLVARLSAGTINLPLQFVEGVGKVTAHIGGSLLHTLGQVGKTGRNAHKGGKFSWADR